MGITSRKKRPLEREGAIRDAKLMVIATEGSHTEGQYFSFFKSSRIQIKILPTTDGKSSPSSVLNRLDQFYKDYDLDPDDYLVLVIDTDRWLEATLSSVAAECSRKGFTLAVSNPCFELWLHLHFSNDIDQSNSCSDYAEEIRKLLGEYNKANLKQEHYTEEAIKDAIKRSKKLANVDDRWPQQHGTDVHKVVKIIQEHIAGD